MFDFNKYRSLLQEVAQHPDDLVPRHIVADYLEEYGTWPWQRHRAALIRRQLDGDKIQPDRSEWMSLLSNDIGPLMELFDGGYRGSLRWVNGFVEQMDLFHCTEQRWVEAGPELVSLMPLKNVYLSLAFLKFDMVSRRSLLNGYPQCMEYIHPEAEFFLLVRQCAEGQHSDVTNNRVNRRLWPYFDGYSVELHDYTDWVKVYESPASFYNTGREFLSNALLAYARQAGE